MLFEIAQVLEGQVPLAFQPKPQPRREISGMSTDLELVGCLPLRRHDLDGPKRCVVAGLEAAANPFCRGGDEVPSSLDEEAGRGPALIRIRSKLHHRHRGNGAEVMRVDDAKQGLADLRKSSSIRR